MGCGLSGGLPETGSISLAVEAGVSLGGKAQSGISGPSILPTHPLGTADGSHLACTSLGSNTASAPTKPKVIIVLRRLTFIPTFTEFLTFFYPNLLQIDI